MKWQYAPVKSDITLGTEEIDMVLELQLEHAVFVDSIARARQTDNVAKQRQAGQRKIILQHCINKPYTKQLIAMTSAH